MPRPTTQDQLLSASQQEHTALEELLATLTPEQMTQPGVLGEWSVKDVLAHLIEWEQMVLGWYKAGRRGQAPQIPAEGFNWGQLPALNQRIYEKHRGRPLGDVLKQFKASYRSVLKAVQGMSEEELFTRGHYAWTKTSALATYVIGCTSSHYHWARTESAQRAGPEKEGRDVKPYHGHIPGVRLFLRWMPELLERQEALSRRCFYRPMPKLHELSLVLQGKGH